MSSVPSSAAPARTGPPMTPDRAARLYMNTTYPKHIWYFLAALLFVVAFLQYTSLFVVKLSSRRRARSHALSNAPHQRLISWGRLPTALVNTYRIIAFRCTLNIGESYTISLAELALTSFYIIALFTWDFVNTTDTAGNRWALAYWSNRSGTIAVSQFPIITVLGTKNNVLSAITLVSYEKLNYLHRMAARVVFVLVWLHAGSKIYNGIEEELDQTFIRLGLVALTAFSLLIIVSLRPIRTRAYELFFYTHFLMVLAILISLYYHTLSFNFAVYVWPSLLIWGLDRFVRGLRIVIFNFFTSPGSDTLEAKTELVSQHFVRVTLRRPPHFHWFPGQTAYLITPGVSTFPFEAHPFTIASYDSSRDPPSSGSGTSSGATSQEKLDEDGKDYWKELVFLVNVRGGFTHRLGEVAAERKTIKAIVDGPYGLSPDLSRFDTSIFIAGGSGVSYTLPVFLRTINAVRAGTSNCTRAVFIWAVRESSHIRWIADGLYNALVLAPSNELSVEIRLFLTGQQSLDVAQWDNESLHSAKDLETAIEVRVPSASPSLLSLPAVNVVNGRPDIEEILIGEANRMHGGRMSVDVCGSSGIARVVRSALGFKVAGPSKILRGGPSITLHVESFGYA